MYFFSIVGLLLSILSGEIRAAQPDVYTTILQKTEFGIGETIAEEEVKTFVTESIKKLHPTWMINETDVDFALQGNMTALCKKDPVKPNTFPECTQLLEELQNLAQEELRVRLLGRYLQNIATGYEHSIDGYPGRPINLPLHFRSIMTIWQAGQSSSSSSSPSSIVSPLVRLRPLPPVSDTYFWWGDATASPPTFGLVGTLFQQLNMIPQKDGEKTAAVWRYQHGVRFVQGERYAPFFSSLPTTPFPPGPTGNQNGAGTERQYLLKRWDGSGGTPQVEQALQEIYDYLVCDLQGSIADGTFFPPPRKGELILFPPIEGEVIVWAFVEALEDWAFFDDDCSMLGFAEEILYTGDTGLQWDLPVEPVLPALLPATSAWVSLPYVANTATSCDELPWDVDDLPWNSDCPLIPGGAYPPEPVRLEGAIEKPLDGLGLCMMPLSRYGYLCKPLQSEQGQICTNDITPEPGSIILTQCVPPDPSIDTTVAGPDVCRSLLWKMTPPPSSSGGSSSAAYLDICSPLQNVTYLNTIGNTMCYLGQCLEQTLETHRIIGGRSPFVTEDQAFPWDFLAPLGITPAGLLYPPPLPQTTFLDYRPAVLLRAIDLSLCQVLGLPPTTPPTLCLSDALRRLRLPLETYADTTKDILGQSTQQEHTFSALEGVIPGVGARIGTHIFLQYLSGASRTFADVVRIAADLFQGLADIQFPSFMCPLGVPS